MMDGAWRRISALQISNARPAELHPLQLVLLVLGLATPLVLPYALQHTVNESALDWSATTAGGGPGELVITRTYWRANAAGLLPGDRIVMANGQVATPELMAALRSNLAAGDTVELLIARRGDLLRVSIPFHGPDVQYAVYRWYRIGLALAAWGIAMALLLWKGTRRPAQLLAAAFLLIPPVTLPIELAGEPPLLTAANIVWQFQAAAYRFLFPFLLVHFFALSIDVPAWLRSRRLWLVLYAIAILGTIAITDWGRQPLAWRAGGFPRQVRIGLGLVVDMIAAGSCLVLGRVRQAPNTLRWLAFTCLLFFGMGIPQALVAALPDVTARLPEMIRQVKSITLLVLIAISTLYLLTLAEDAEPGEWHKRGRLAAATSILLTAVYGFALAGAAAIVHSAEAHGTETDWTLFLSIFAAAILLSPILRWSRELVDQRIFARWMQLEARARAFVERISADLQPSRIGEAVAQDLRNLLEVTSAELVLTKELIRSWSDPPDVGLRLEPQATLAREAAERNADGMVIVPVTRPTGEIIGVLRIGPRLDGRRFEPPEDALLRSLAQGVAAALRNAEAYLELRRAQQERDMAERVASLGALAGGLAHEIKNPLASLKMGLYLLERDGVGGERLSRIQHDVRRIDDLVTGLLRYTSNGETIIPASRLDVCAIVRACVEDLRPTAADRDVRIEESYPSEPACAIGGEEQVRLIMSNLLTNAIDAAGAGGVVAVKVHVDKDEISIAVQDSGPGIPEPLRQSMFQLGFSTKPAGTGIGLAVARREAEYLGGRIEVVASAESGSCLRVALPLAPAPRTVEPDAASS